MKKKCTVVLTETERIDLKQVVSSGKGPARRLAHARILLKADEGPEGPGLRDEAIAEAVEVGLSTVARVRRRFVKEGLEAALNRRLPRRTRRRKLDGRQEAQLIALACSPAPQGEARWTFRLLADKMVELEYVGTVSYGTVRRVLKKTSLSLG
jgi:transposase